MRSFEKGALALVTLAGCGCSDAVSPERTMSVAAADLAAAGAPQRVTGSATILLPQFGNALERYSVSAVQHNDGSVSGEFEETSEQEGGQRIHARVYCFTVTGNTARLAARIEQTNVSFGPPGSYVVWSLIDNGEGPKSPPDQTTDIFFGGTQAQAEHHCKIGFNLAPYFSTLRGNLQVR